MINYFCQLINSNGGYYRTIFLRKKNLRWEDVDVISILKGKDYGKVKYNAVVCGRDSIDLVWGVSTFEGDDYHDLYKVIDYYVQKYNIKVTLENTWMVVYINCQECLKN